MVKLVAMLRSMGCSLFNVCSKLSYPAAVCNCQMSVVINFCYLI